MDKFEFIIINGTQLWADGVGHSIEEWKIILQEKNVQFDKLIGIKRND